MIDFFILYGAVGAALIGTMQLLVWAARKDGEAQRRKNDRTAEQASAAP